MKVYQVHVDFDSPDSKGVTRTEVFRAPSELDAIKAGVEWVGKQLPEGNAISEVAISRYVLPSVDPGETQLNYDYPDQFFHWDFRCLLPLDVFTAAFLQAARGLESPGQ
jgi:hypothetical protein